MTLTVTHHVFQEIYAYGRADIRCRVCNKHISKRVTESCTINPFNKNAAGEMCSREEVRAQAQAKVDVEVARLIAEGRTCTKCELAASPPYIHKNVSPETLANTIAMHARMAALMKEARDGLDTTAWVGRDVIYNGRLAIVEAIYFSNSAMNDTVVVGIRYYSKRLHARPGETMGDTIYTRLDTISLVES